MGAFAWNAAALPYAAVSVAALVLAGIVALTRGDPLVRFSLLAILLIGVTYIGGAALSMSCTDPELASRIARVQVGPIALMGPVMMLGILSVAGLAERYLWLVAVAGLLALTSTVAALFTDLVIRRAWLTDWNIWFPRAGPLNDLHVGQFVIWAVAGAFLARRGQPASAKQAARRRRFMVVVVFGLFGATDAALAHGYGVYPFSVVPAAAAVAVGYTGVLRHDILRARGFDRAMALELLVLALLFASVALVWSGLRSRSVALASAAIVGLLVIAQLAVALVRKSAARDRAEAELDERPFDEFVEAATRTRSEAELAVLVREVLDAQLGLVHGALYVADSEGNLVREGADPVAVDRRVRAWLIANRRPLVTEDLSSRRLGGLRAPIEAFLGSAGGEVVVPVVDRGALVGLITSAAPRGGRALRDDESELLTRIAAASGRAIAYLALFREAAERVEVAREVEVASAVQAARSQEGECLRFQRCQVDIHFRAATQFGGDWWACHELSDGRLLVVVGDVTGRGVPAALVSFTVEGACETAQRMLGAGIELVALMELLNESVREVGRDTYSMTCFAALFDFDDSAVTFCNAGHPFPYVVGKSGPLRSLICRGTPLGTEEPILRVSRVALEPGDVVVFYSDAVVSSRSPEGVLFGERRLQKVLRQSVPGAGDQALRVIVEAAEAHYGGAPIVDDVTLVVVRTES